MSPVRGVVIVVVVSWVTAASIAQRHDLDADYLDDLKEFASEHVEGISAKYSEKLSKIDLLEDYPHDEELHKHEYDYEDDEDDDDDDEDDDDDDDDEDDDEDDDDDEGGGCGGGDDDDDEEELTPVQEVIEEYFTR